MSIELPHVPDENTYILLNRARLMLSHAQEHAAHGSEIDRMVAIHGFDNTVEYLLRIILNFLDVEGRTGRSVDSVDLASLAGEVNRFLLKEYNIRLPYLSEVKLLRQVRNLVQHGVVDPNPDLKRFATITDRFYEAVLQRVFGIAKDELKTSVIINHATLREHLISCEKAIEEKKYLEAIVAARDAFENGYYQRTKDSDVTISMMPAIVEARVTKSQGLWSLVKVMEELELSRLGINTAEYRRFNDYLRYIPSGFQASDSGHIVIKRPWAIEDAKFCYAFVASTLLKWQSNDAPPIQEYNFNPDDNETSEFIDEVNLNGPYEGGCFYFYDDDHELQLWYFDKDTKDLLESLEIGKEYEYLLQIKEAGSIKREVRHTVELLGLHSSLITNVPERWQVIAWYRSSNDYVSKVIEADTTNIIEE